MADEKASHGSNPEVWAVAPRYAEYTEKLLFGDVWERPGLAPRDRSLVVVAALIALNRAPYLQFHGRRALDNGVTPRELSEIATHLSFYCGWPCATPAVTELGPIFKERGVTPQDVAPIDLPLLDLEPAAEAARKQAVAAGIAPTSPSLAKDTDDVLFADLWRRQDLSARDRSLVTVAALAAMGQAEQMTFHVNRALDNGMTEAEMGEAISHLAYYVGWPRAVSASGVVRRILDDRAARQG